MKLNGTAVERMCSTIYKGDFGVLLSVMDGYERHFAIFKFITNELEEKLELIALIIQQGAQ